MGTFGRFYLDKEKDIVVDLELREDTMHYTLRTPHHHTGNLITNLAKLCDLPIGYSEDGLKIILIQDNKVHVQGADTALENLDKVLDIRTEADAEHTFKATHEYFVRHKLETYTRKLVVKLTGEENKFKLDFYLSSYPIENDPRAVYVVKELESLYKSGSRTSDLTDVLTLTFVTDKAYGDDDWKIYDFTITEYIGIKLFDGNYILSFYASLPKGIEDTTKDFNDEESVRKFKNKEPRKKDNTVALAGAISLIEDGKKEKIDEKQANELVKKVKKKK
jgi:hypothetical protein